MRRTTIVAVLALIGMLFCVPSNTAEAGSAPTITSVLEGVDPATDQVVVLLLGKKLNRFKEHRVLNEIDADLGAAELVLKSSKMIALRLPTLLPSGTYKLSMRYGKDSVMIQPCTITNGGVRPGMISLESLDAPLSADIEDATSLNGHPPDYFLDCDNVAAGTLSAERFSAIADLAAEARIGTGADQLATGNHLHDQNYSALGHDHAGIYSLDAHDHAALYSAIAHDHATLYSALAHDHAGVYSESAHDHNAAYVLRTGDTINSRLWVDTSYYMPIQGTTSAAVGFGVTGKSTATTGAGNGVRGWCESNNSVSAGVFANANRSGGTALIANGQGTSGYIARFMAQSVDKFTVDRAGNGVFKGGCNFAGGLTVGGGGTFAGVVIAPLFVGISDARLKENITELRDVVPRLRSVRAVRYRLKKSAGGDGTPQLGVLAQEVQKQFPELVEELPSGHLGVNYGNFTAVLLQAVKEQQQEIDDLKARLDRIEQRLGGND